MKLFSTLQKSQLDPGVKLSSLGFVKTSHGLSFVQFIDQLRDIIWCSETTEASPNQCHMMDRFLLFATMAGQ